jgi:hypothetical protein
MGEEVLAQVIRVGELGEVAAQFQGDEAVNAAPELAADDLRVDSQVP